MKASLADAAGMDASPTAVACDTDEPIKIWTVTQGRCRRVRTDHQLRIRHGHNVRGRSPT
jgi:hypothetical protein